MSMRLGEVPHSTPRTFTITHLGCCPSNSARRPSAVYHGLIWLWLSAASRRRIILPSDESGNLPTDTAVCHFPFGVRCVFPAMPRVPWFRNRQVNRGDPVLLRADVHDRAFGRLVSNDQLLSTSSSSVMARSRFRLRMAEPTIDGLARSQRAGIIPRCSAPSSCPLVAHSSDCNLVRPPWLHVCACHSLCPEAVP